MQNKWHLFLVAQRLWEVSSVKSIIAGSFLAEISFWASVGLLTAVTMYGFVNQALQEFVIRESSFETWEEILYVYLQISICKSAIGSKAVERSDFRQSKSIDVNNNVTDFSLAIDCIPWFLPRRKKANLDLGETGEFNQRRIYDDQNTFDLLRVASEVLGEYTTVSVYSICLLFRSPRDFWIFAFAPFVFYNFMWKFSFLKWRSNYSYIVYHDKNGIQSHPKFARFV